MKRLLFSALLWGAATLPLVVQAQSRGGMMGGRVGMAPPAHISSGTMSARPAPAMHSMPVSRPMQGARPGAMPFTPSQRAFMNRGMNRGVTSSSRFTSNNFRRFRNGRFFRSPFFFNGQCFNGAFTVTPGFCNGFSSTLFPFGGFGGFGGFGYPYYGYGFDSPYDYSSQQQQPQQSAVATDDSVNRELSMQVQHLSDEVEFMREEGQRAEARTAPAQPTTEREANTILIFRDGQRFSTPSYAISGKTIWVMFEHTSRKFSIDDLDVDATVQANAKNGVEFHAPHTENQ